MIREGFHEFSDYLRVGVSDVVGLQIYQEAVKPLMGLGESFTYYNDELLILTHEVNLSRFNESISAFILKTESVPYLFSCHKLADGVKYFIRKRHSYQRSCLGVNVYQAPIFIRPVRNQFDKPSFRYNWSSRGSSNGRNYRSENVWSMFYKVR